MINRDVGQDGKEHPCQHHPFAPDAVGKPPKDDKEARIRGVFYETGFYMVRLVYKSKQKLKDQKKKETGIRDLADRIVGMEKDPRTSDFGGANVRKLYQDWLDEEPAMRKAYEAAQGKALLTSYESP